MSTTVKVVRKNPSGLSPQCITRSACTEPGCSSFHSLQVRIGICPLRAVGADDDRRGCRPSFLRQSRNWRSMVAALIETRSSRTRRSRRSSPYRSRASTSAGKTAASSLPHILSRASQTLTSASVTSDPYRCGRPFFLGTAVRPRPLRKRRIAAFRCIPLVWQNSSRIRLFSRFLALAYRGRNVAAYSYNVTRVTSPPFGNPTFEATLFVG